MPVMNVRVVRMSMCDGFMCVFMRMRFVWINIRNMLVLVVLIMNMLVIMCDRFMRMFMRVPFREMEPHSCPHEQRGDK